MKSKIHVLLFNAVLTFASNSENVELSNEVIENNLAFAGSSGPMTRIWTGTGSGERKTFEGASSVPLEVLRSQRKPSSLAAEEKKAERESPKTVSWKFLGSASSTALQGRKRATAEAEEEEGGSKKKRANQKEKKKGGRWRDEGKQTNKKTIRLGSTEI